MIVVIVHYSTLTFTYVPHCYFNELWYSIWGHRVIQYCNMKTPIHFIKKAAVLLSSLFFLSVTVQAQDAKQQKRQDIKQLLESKEYVFKAQSVTPVRGGFRQLTTEYDLRLLGDSLVSYLPYFGRAYTAPLDPRETGIQFTSTQFKYELTPRKRGWDVTLRPTDVSNVQQMVLSVTPSGRATLQVISTNREPISFNGVVVRQR